MYEVTVTGKRGQKVQNFAYTGETVAEARKRAIGAAQHHGYKVVAVLKPRDMSAPTVAPVANDMSQLQALVAAHNTTTDATERQELREEIELIIMDAENAQEN